MAHSGMPSRWYGLSFLCALQQRKNIIYRLETNLQFQFVVVSFDFAHLYNRLHTSFNGEQGSQIIFEAALFASFWYLLLFNNLFITGVYNIFVFILIATLISLQGFAILVFGQISDKSTPSRPLGEVKLARAGSVIWAVRTCEAPVLKAHQFFYFFNCHFRLFTTWISVAKWWLMAAGLLVGFVLQKMFLGFSLF